jgi:hypothetical protein
MSDILFQYYAVNPTTWFYLSSLLAIALFFKFNRVWSIRNLDLLGLILLAPGLLAYEYGSFKANEPTLELGFVWLFAVSGLFLLRMLFDSTMVRRPMLEPNLTTGGLVFLGIALLVFLLANVITKRPQREDVAVAATADRLRAGEANVDADQLAKLGPGYPLLSSCRRSRRSGCSRPTRRRPPWPRTRPAAPPMRPRPARWRSWPSSRSSRA